MFQNVVKNNNIKEFNNNNNVQSDEEVDIVNNEKDKNIKTVEKYKNIKKGCVWEGLLGEVDETEMITEKQVINLCKFNVSSEFMFGMDSMCSYHVTNRKECVPSMNFDGCFSIRGWDGVVTTRSFRIWPEQSIWFNDLYRFN